MSVLSRLMTAVPAVAFGCAAYVYLTLPDVRPLRASNPGTTAFIELRAREARTRGPEPRRDQRWVPYARISPHLKRAVLVAEDAGFWRHDGLDYGQLRASVEVNIERREFARGASTITQQLAKNLYLSPSKNPVRKIRELLIARRLEIELTKQRILELYLNVIEWGDGIYGVEAAARTYFGTSAAALGPQESAMLAAAIISPRAFNPGRPSARLQRRQQMILRRMGAVRPPPVLAGPAPERRSELAPLPPAPSSPDLPVSGPLLDLPGEAVLPASSRPSAPCGTPPCS